MSIVAVGFSIADPSGVASSPGSFSFEGVWLQFSCLLKYRIGQSETVVADR
jgi:hypothetical protein